MVRVVLASVFVSVATVVNVEPPSLDTLTVRTSSASIPCMRYVKLSDADV